MFTMYFVSCMLQQMILASVKIQSENQPEEKIRQLSCNTKGIQNENRQKIIPAVPILTLTRNHANVSKNDADRLHVSKTALAQESSNLKYEKQIVEQLWLALYQEIINFNEKYSEFLFTDKAAEPKEGNNRNTYISANDVNDYVSVIIDCHAAVCDSILKKRKVLTTLQCVGLENAVANIKLDIMTKEYVAIYLGYMSQILDHRFDSDACKNMMSNKMNSRQDMPVAADELENLVNPSIHLDKQPKQKQANQNYN